MNAKDYGHHFSGYQQSQPPASDPWANGGSDPEF